MSERSIIITEGNGTYQIRSSAFNEYELLGLFEQIVFDLKYLRAEKSSKEISREAEQSAESLPPAIESTPNVMLTAPVTPEENIQPKDTVPERIAGVSGTAATDLRTRIGNAVKAIRDLGGRVESNDLTKMTNEELQIELEELTAQYKRLKGSRKS